MKAVALFSLREAIRRRVFIVVAVVTCLCGVLYGLIVWQASHFTGDLSEGQAIDPKIISGATLLALSMFGTLFLGAILAAFLTLGAVRGDAAAGVIQPVLVRPISRREYLAARWLAAAGVCAIYVTAVFTGAVVITGIFGDWWPDRVIVPLLQLIAGVVIIAALSLAGSVVLSATANGIAIFMCFGAGLVAGLLGQLGEGLNNKTLVNISDVATHALPFEALYQAAMAEITADTFGITRLAIQLGPLGGAQAAGPWLWLWCLAYLAAVGALATAAFHKTDL